MDTVTRNEEKEPLNGNDVLIDILGAKEYFGLNAKLQQKKNALRQELADMGKVGKDKKNDYDRYTYFSEAGYKELFTKLFSKNKLELSTNLDSIDDIEATDKQPFGRRANIEFRLSDIETGFYEISIYSGEGFDKGDKSLYKAYTGALKYYLANTFNVATGDDAEKESPEGARTSAKSKHNSKAKTDEIRLLNQGEIAKLENLIKLTKTDEKTVLGYYKVKQISELNINQYNQILQRLAGKTQETEETQQSLADI